MTYHPTDQDRREVETMAGMGFTAKEIGKVKGLTFKTLQKHFRGELELGQIKANMRVASKLFQLATRQNASAAACIFWLKVRGGWKEPVPDAAPGKKEQAEIDARDADKGTHWAGLLN